jgi:hypothetical protein
MWRGGAQGLTVPADRAPLRLMLLIGMWRARCAPVNELRQTAVRLIQAVTAEVTRSAHARSAWWAPSYERTPWSAPSMA